MDKFSARETEWMLELDGIPLAGFWQRALAFVIDWALISVLLTVVVSVVAVVYFLLHRGEVTATILSVVQDKGPGPKMYHPKIFEWGNSELAKAIKDLAIAILYFGLLLWQGKGRTPGKRLMKIRVVSVVHRHLSLWHSVERALGYGAAALEGGFGFAQFFIHPYRRCVQDRIAETIVVTEAGYQAMQKKLDHPLVPDAGVLGRED
jgi:uncharacterized RDD family membrane protein YckC